MAARSTNWGQLLQPPSTCNPVNRPQPSVASHPPGSPAHYRGIFSLGYEAQYLAIIKAYPSPLKIIHRQGNLSGKY
jgi:hypothetical protein